MPTLDGVRGFAILWVVVHNASVIDEPLSGALGHVLSSGLAAGWAGVSLFFALSGFLITGILLDSQAGPNFFRNFYARRALRIFPLFYGVLFVAFVVLPLFGRLPERLATDVPHQIWLWTYLSNWSAPFDIATKTFPHFWSLAVEEQFYLFWPLVIWRRNANSVLLICLAVAAASLLSRIAMIALGATPEMLYTFTMSRMDALALGGAAAAGMRAAPLSNWLQQNAGRLMLFSVGSMLVCVSVLHGLPRMSPLGQTFGYTSIAISFSALVVALACADRRGDRSWWSSVWRIAPLRQLAKYSYGMYVFHKLIEEAIGKPFMRAQSQALRQSIGANVIYLVVFTLLTLAVAILSYHLLEKHFLRLQPLFPKRLSTTSTTC